MQPSSSRPSQIDLWVSLALMLLITLILCVATIIMMAIGGVFLPFGFNSDWFNRLLPPLVLVPLGMVTALVVGAVAVVTMVQVRRRDRAAS
jgi:hypothetical protein